MKCVHYWVTDARGFARCQRCPATKQCPGYKRPKLKLGAMGSTKPGEFGIHPDRCTRSYVRVT